MPETRESDMNVITDEEFQFAELMVLIRGRRATLADAIEVIYEQAFAALNSEAQAQYEHVHE